MTGEEAVPHIHRLQRGRDFRAGRPSASEAHDDLLGPLHHLDPLVLWLLKDITRTRYYRPFTCVLSHSVVSDSLRPHGLQPARLLCPWDSPGKNTGVGCRALLQGSSPPRDGTNICYASCTGRRVLDHERHLGSPGPHRTEHSRVQMSLFSQSSLT